MPIKRLFFLLFAVSSVVFAKDRPPAPVDSGADEDAIEAECPRAESASECKRKCNKKCDGASNKSKCVGTCRRACDA